MRFIVASFLGFVSLFGLSFPNVEAKNNIEILNKFDIDSSFLTNSFFIDSKSYFLDDYKKKYIYERFASGVDFIPTLKSMLNEAGVPPEFLYMAMVESGFSLKAHSYKGAAGIWQFMPATARIYGLRIDEYIDERRDPIKSTRAAIRYLTNLNSIFGKWYLTAMAYNCGEGAVIRAIKRANSDDLATLIDPNKKYLPRETRNYIRYILSLSMLFNNINQTQRDNVSYILNAGASDSIVEVEVSGGVHLKDIADSADIPYQKLQAYNSHLKFDYIPHHIDSYSIYMPYDSMALFMANFDKESFKEKSRKNYIIHIVQKGDTLYDLGRKYDIPYRMIKDINRLSSTRLSLKQKLLIPQLPNPITKLDGDKTNTEG
ncbi:MAG: transglycosylase SLT domain-containing protein [Campylobacterales bacterium]